MAKAKNGPVLLPRTVLDKASLLKDPENFALACGDVRAVLEQTIRFCKTHQAKRCEWMFCCY